MGKHSDSKNPSQDTNRSLRSGDKKVVFKFNRWMILGAAGLVIIAGVALSVTLMRGGEGQDVTPVLPSASSPASPAVSYSSATLGHEAYPLVEADASGTLRFPEDTFADNAAHYYTYVHNGQSIEFFVLRSGDGIVRAAFNACDTCYRSLKGYRQSGQIMICNNCGQQFPADRINIARGGCNPAPLDRTIEGTYLVIEVDDVMAGASYF